MMKVWSRTISLIWELAKLLGVDFEVGRSPRASGTRVHCLGHPVDMWVLVGTGEARLIAMIWVE